MSTTSRAAEVVGLANEQRGLITSRQARSIAGVTPQQLKQMADSGVLERLHHGLYRVARFPYDEHQEKRVAWIAIDPARVVWERLDQDVPTGVLSHRTAAEMHQLGDLDADVVELTAARRIRLALPDIEVHRGELVRDDWQVVDGLPVTTPVRTIDDLAAAFVDAGHLATVVREALTRSLVATEDVVTVLAAHAFRYGYRPFDGDGFLEALIEQAGVSANTVALAEIAARAAARPTSER
ncbi:type IV toxin-antitoxin system AbiEi family antitoxin domain-containing protein [Nocardia sp. NPDC058480]